MKVLVTGGAGFIGSHVVDQLLSRGIPTLVVDNLTGASGSFHVNPQAVLYTNDIRDEALESIFAQELPDTVIHLAAQINVQHSQKNPPFDAGVNVLGTLHILRLCQLYRVRKVIFASSAAVYGKPEYLSIDEEHTINPLSCYGLSKSAAESYIRLYAEMHDLKYTILRFANVFGPRQFADGEAGVVSIFVDKLLRGERPIIYGDGNQTRDFVYVEDVAEAVISAIGRADNETINISSGRPTSVSELVVMLGKLMGRNVQPVHDKERLGDIAHSYLSNWKARDTLYWMPDNMLEEGLRKTIASLYENSGAVSS